MWCPTCQQDVPAIAAAKGDGFTCPRCGIAADTASVQPGGADDEQQIDAGIDLAAADLANATRPFDFGHEKLDADLERTDRLLRRPPIWAANKTVAAPGAGLPTGIEQSNPQVAPNPQVTTRQQTVVQTPTRQFTAPIAWLLVAVGQGVFSCGAALLVWSHVLGRPDIWEIGLVLTPGGLFAITLGLLLRLERVWSFQRAACERLIEVDREISELNKTTELLSTRPANPSQAFYSHLAHGASPHMLVSDLQGQLDLLAQRLAAERK